MCSRSPDRDKFLSDSHALVTTLMDDYMQPETVGVIRPLVSAIDLMMDSEDHFRASERRRELGIELPVAQAELDRAERLNTAAIEILDTVLPTRISILRDRLSAIGTGEVEPAIALFDQLARERLADSGLNVYQTREAGAILDRGMLAARSGGDAVCDQLEQEIARLSEMRSVRRNENDPVAATFAVIFALGAVAIMTYATSPGGPGVTVGLFSVFILLLFAAVTLGIVAVSALPWAAAA